MRIEIPTPTKDMCVIVAVVRAPAGDPVLVVPVMASASTFVGAELNPAEAIGPALLTGLREALARRAELDGVDLK